MLWLSELMLKNHHINNFDELIPLAHEGAKNGEIFFRMDVKPAYFDTPENWEEKLESAFSGRL